MDNGRRATAIASARAARQVFLETPRTGSVGSAAIECEDDLHCAGVGQMTIFHLGQFDSVADKGAGLSTGAQGH